MHSAIKMIIGVLILIAGLYWYLADAIAANMASTWLGLSAITALKSVFIGVFGLVLIFVGLLVVWIEYEDLKWDMQNKKKK
ncbi:MAG: hypothetical protein V1870_03440 [Candidatus Aenigmatarchaeota archaeon]